MNLGRKQAGTATTHLTSAHSGSSVPCTGRTGDAVKEHERSAKHLLRTWETQAIGDIASADCAYGVLRARKLGFRGGTSWTIVA